MGQLTISMAIFNSKLLVYQRVSMYIVYLSPCFEVQDPSVVNHACSNVAVARFVASGSVDALDSTRVMLVQGARYELETAEPQEGQFFLVLQNMYLW